MKTGEEKGRVIDMEEKEPRDLLAGRLYIELQLFKYSILGQTKEKIYKASYKIEVMANTYEILLQEIACLDKEAVYGFLYQNFSILEQLYQEWLTREDGVFDELKAYVGSEMENIGKIKHLTCGKEKENGTESDQAA